MTRLSLILRSPSFLRLLSRTAGVLAAGAGAAALVGWALGIEGLKSLLPGARPIMPNAALCFVLAGALLAGYSVRFLPFRVYRYAGQLTALLVAGLGVVALFEYVLLGWHLGIHHWILKEELEAFSFPYPGRMASMTALNFVLAGLALWLFYRTSPQRHALAQSLACVVIFSSLSALVGYVGEARLSGITLLTQMPVSTSVAFILLSLGLLFAEPDKGFMVVVTSPSTGGVLARRLLPAVIAIPVAFSWIRSLVAHDALYRSRVDVWVFSMTSMAVFTVLILRSAHLLYRFDREKKEAEKVLRQKEKETRSIIETANDAFIAIDEKGVIIDWNRHAEILFGWSRSEAVGRALAETLVPPWYRDGHRRGLKRFLETGEGPLLNKRIELSALHYEGYQFPVELIIWPVRVGEGYRFNAFVHDITERKKAEEKVKEAIQLRSDFASMVSHELRTPLAVIKESVAIVEDGTAGDLNPEQKDFLGTAKKNVDRLTRLINAVLDYQKLDSQRAAFHLEPCGVNKLILETQKGFDLVAKAKKLELATELAEGLPEVPADKDRIASVLINLVNNAIKFTDKGRIVIRTAKEGENAVRVSVEDQGIGIREEDLPKLFISFSQISSAGERKTGGTGLGLAISRKIVEAHKGRIGVESEVGRGSTFYFILPVKERRTE